MLVVKNVSICSWIMLVPEVIAVTSCLWRHRCLLLGCLLTHQMKSLYFFPLPFVTLSVPPLPVGLSHHGRSPPGRGLPVHGHIGGHRSAAFPPGPDGDLPLRCALLEETHHPAQGTSSLPVTRLFDCVVCL